MSTPLEEKIRESLHVSQALNGRLAKQSLLYYLDNVIIASKPEPRRFGEAADWWQRELVAQRVQAYESLAGFYEYSGPRNFLSILGRGHDKSSFEGRVVTWLLLASRRPIHAYIIAADKDQGKLILQAMEDEAKLNPWVYDQLEFQHKAVYGPSGFVEVVPADAGSAYGLRGDLYICDEITNWSDGRGSEMWSAIASGREKMPGSVLDVLSNAGVLDSWQHEIHETVKHLPSWAVFEHEGHLASWMKEEKIQELALLLPPGEAERLLWNRWIDPATQYDYLRAREVDGCLEDSAGLMIRMRREPDVINYVASLDYGARRDRTALCVVHLDRKKRVIVDRLDVWQGDPADPVQIPRVEDWIKDIKAKFNPVAWVLDDSEIEGTVQWMERSGYPVERFAPRGGAGNYELAQHLRSLIVNRSLLWYESAGNLPVTKRGQTKVETFRDELLGLRVKKMSYGFRFDHETQKHDDRAVAVGMAALRAMEHPPKDKTDARPPVLPDDNLQTGYNFPINGPVYR